MSELLRHRDLQRITGNVVIINALPPTLLFLFHGLKFKNGIENETRGEEQEEASYHNRFNEAYNKDVCAVETSNLAIHSSKQRDVFGSRGKAPYNVLVQEETPVVLSVNRACLPDPSSSIFV